MPTVELTEAQFTRQVRDLAQLFGWRRYHTWLSKHSTAGFPDEVLVRRGRLIFAELKNRTNAVSPAQQEWLDDIAEVSGVEVYVWRPGDLDEIVEVLR